jgi:hypothetical protein
MERKQLKIILSHYTIYMQSQGNGQAPYKSLTATVFELQTRLEDVESQLKELKLFIEPETLRLKNIEDQLASKLFLNDIPKQYFKLQYVVKTQPNTITTELVNEHVNKFFSYRRALKPTFVLWDWKQKKDELNTTLEINFIFRVDNPISVSDFKQIYVGDKDAPLYVGVLEDGYFQIINYIKYYGIASKLENPNDQVGAEIWKIGGDDKWMCNTELNDEVFTASTNYINEQLLQLYFVNCIKAKNWLKLFNLKYA